MSRRGKLTSTLRSLVSLLTAVGGDHWYRPSIRALGSGRYSTLGPLLILLDIISAEFHQYGHGRTHHRIWLMPTSKNLRHVRREPSHPKARPKSCICLSSSEIFGELVDALCASLSSFLVALESFLDKLIGQCCLQEKLHSRSPCFRLVHTMIQNQFPNSSKGESRISYIDCSLVNRVSNTD